MVSCLSVLLLGIIHYVFFVTRGVNVQYCVKCQLSSNCANESGAESESICQSIITPIPLCIIQTISLHICMEIVLVTKTSSFIHLAHRKSGLLMFQFVVNIASNMKAFTENIARME